MRNAKHTAAPWQFIGLQNGAIHEVFAARSGRFMEQIAVVHDTEKVASIHNARLIAAAPELVAALQYALDVLRTHGDTRQVEQAIAAALAKAGV